MATSRTPNPLILKTTMDCFLIADLFCSLSSTAVGLIGDVTSFALPLAQAATDDAERGISWKQYLALGIAIAVGATVAIVRLLRRKKPRWFPKTLRQSKKTQPIGFRDIEAYLEEQNLGRGTAETPKRWILRLETKLPHTQVSSLQQIMDLHYRDRFDPEGLSVVEKADYLEHIKQWLAEVRSPQKEKPSVVS